MAGPRQGAAGSGRLGPLLAAALRDYQGALVRLGRAEAALEAARREASESHARLQALTTGARLSGERVLLAVDDAPEEHADLELSDQERAHREHRDS